MSFRSFRNAGHAPTLLSAFLYFDVSFMIWVILGPLGPFIGETLKLSAAQKGFLTAVPLLGGSFFRLLLGACTERFGSRRTALTGMALTLVPLLIGWKFAAGFAALLGMGVLLGISGASFAAALPLASGWYPPEYQGLAMGIAGAGNSGTLMASLFAPRLAQIFGWHNVFAFVSIPLIIVWVVFYLLAKDAPVQRSVKTWTDYASVLKIPDSGWFCFLYSLTFGGFSGFASYLSIFFRDQYGVSRVTAGDLTTLVVLFGSFLRPIGGVLADRIGGYRMLLVLFAIAILALALLTALPATAIAVTLFVVLMAMLGMGNGSVFQLVPQRFPDHIGMVTGLVGAAGGLGGFMLPSLMGLLKERTGSFATGFAVTAGLFTFGLSALLWLKTIWRQSWTPIAAERAGLLSTEPATASSYATD
ncbi:MAG: NarK/NasA family nitrate transporter [Acidobacteriaceae bacterium]|nr:NarK/NasA family nitrate transporter [Acidobacteriaceae bacterium]MBV9442162.1 NarK/NasA family nitrate transporter [Acidobacteriaceae bacterium]